jgi:signal peptidase I
VNINRIFWNRLGHILCNTILILLLIVVGIILISTINFPGNIKLYSVQSGSMEPAIMMGSVVIVKPVSTYQIGDVITVTDPTNLKMTITHRVVETDNQEGKITYITKGDANKTNDTEARPLEGVLGKVVFVVPFLGYPVSFAKTSEGLLILVIIPAIIIIFSELLSIKSEAQKLIEKRRQKKIQPTEKIVNDIGEEKIKGESLHRKKTENIHPEINNKSEKS